MRRRVLILLTIVCLPGVLPAQEEEAQDTKALADEVARQALAEARLYEFSADPANQSPIELRETPVLKWSNTYNVPCYGSVFIWTCAGRPAVIGSIYRFATTTKTMNAEFHSLLETPLTAERNGRVEWQPAEPGVVFRAVDGAPAPAATPSKRLTQMRDIARDFSAELTTVLKKTHRLRLMTQPLVRYEAPELEVSDGAIFTLSRETDPEVLILLEARAGRWEYALARLNGGTIIARFKDKEVWRVEEIPHPYRRNRERYSTLKVSLLPAASGESVEK